MSAGRDAGDPVRVLVVGQTPPPFGGQAIMIQRMLDHDYEGVDIHHVRMAFSQEISEAGKFQLRKIGHLVAVIARISWTTVRARPDILYYPPAGPKRVPVLRDMAVLLSTRWMFRRTIFHFHATDLPAIYPTLPSVVKPLFRLAYGEPDLAIATSEYNVGDAEALHAKRHVVIPNCVDVGAKSEHGSAIRGAGPCRLLFVGLVTPTKGVEDILEAGSILLSRGCAFEVVLVGKVESPEFEKHIVDLATDRGLRDLVTLTGELSGPDVDRAYEDADVFVFPTRGRSESFGIVLLEAMAHGLPVVGSGLGGVRSIIRDGVNGFYVESDNPPELADALERLIRDPGLRARMGQAGRQLLEQEYTEDAFYARMREAFMSVD